MKLSLPLLVGWNGALEALVGASLFIYPQLPTVLLFGDPPAGSTKAIALLLGSALFAFGSACWLARKAETVGLHAAGRGLQTYNLLAAFLFTYLAATPAPHGILAWPVAGLHLALWLAFTISLRRDIARLRTELRESVQS